MNQKFNLKTNNFIKNMLRYSYLIIMALLLNAVVNEIICATFGSSGNGLFAGFQELWMLLKSVWFWYISNKQVT